MAAKHRKPRRRRSSAKRGVVPSLAAAAITATGLTTALTTGTTVTVSPAVELMATITPASSTAQVIASPTFYGWDYTRTYGEQQTVPFFLGPQGIVDAIRASNDPSAVLSSGWGAGQTGTALGQLSGDPALKNVKLVILDNNTNRAGGGFWTTYAIFAPLLLTSSQPTPNNPGVPVLDVGYDYNINGNAPTYPVNLLADLNSLVAYAYGYADQSSVQLPNEVAKNLPANGGDPKNLKPGTHYVVDSNGTVIHEYDNLNTKITYVTFKSDRLPLVKPLLLIPGGNIVADGIEPVLTVLVNAGYKDNQPIPADPSVPRPMGVVPVKESVTALQQLPGAVVQGVHNVQHDLSSGDVFSTSNQPNASTTTVNTLASKPSASSSSPAPKPGGQINPFSIRAGSKLGVDENKPSTPSSDNNNPGQQVIGGLKSALNGLNSTLGIGPKKPSDSETSLNPSKPSGPSAGSAPKN